MKNNDIYKFDFTNEELKEAIDKTFDEVFYKKTFTEFVVYPEPEITIDDMIEYIKNKDLHD